MQKMEVTNFRNFCLKKFRNFGTWEKTEFPEIRKSEFPEVQSLIPIRNGLNLIRLNTPVCLNFSVLSIFPSHK